MMDKYVRPSVPEDIELLIPNIPPEDSEDVMDGWGMTASQALRKIFPALDECYTIMDGTRVVGMFGVMPDGNVWLMRGGGIDSVALRFCRHGHEYVGRWLGKYGVLTGYINKRYKKFIRWLAWEGFEMTDAGRGYLQVRRAA